MLQEQNVKAGAAIYQTENSTVQRSFLADVGLLVLLAVALLLFHQFTNHQYGFHRDELGLLDDARYLDWGYVSYPPLTPLIARVAMEWFGTSLVTIRFFSALAQAVAMVLTGLMARELGGGRWAQVVAAIAMAAAPISMLMGAMFQYVSFDYLWWVLTAYFLIRLLKSDNPRWWLAIGATLGVGMMTKYTIAFLVAGVAGGVLLTPARRYLRSPWLWAGAGLSLLIILPNLLWQIQHDFISLDFLNSIHARDVRIGRTSGYLPEQLYVTTSTLTIPLWVTGLIYYFFLPEGKRYRPLGWVFVISFLLFLVMQGRSYYIAAAYPMLLAAGAVVWERWLAARPVGQARWGRGVIGIALGLSLVSSVLLMTPVAPVNSALWDVTSTVHDNFREQIGWSELVETVAQIYNELPEEERVETRILTGNYGEAGAINLYGPDYELPEAISGVNTLWLRGYGDPAPTQVIVLGYLQEEAEEFFATCTHIGRVTNRYSVENEETTNHPDIWLCREPRLPWPELWPQLQHFG
jgi:4-amino-4-deoxy-L-arabinose transferase-like glycosyltransferase